jgi:hypothetical protein
MTFQVIGSPYSAPIPYGVTIHPFANITVVDSSLHPNISAQVVAGGAGNSSLQGTNLIAYNGSAHGTYYIISNLGSPSNPENLPPITAAQMTLDLRSIVYTSGEPDPSSPTSSVGGTLYDGSATASFGFLPQNVSQVVTLQQNATLITATDPATQAYILANLTRFNILDNLPSPTLGAGQVGYDFGRHDLHESSEFSNSIVRMTTGDSLILGNGTNNTVYMGGGTETVNDGNLGYLPDIINAGSGLNNIVVNNSNTNVTINSGSGTTHVNIGQSFGVGPSNMTFVGGSGVATAFDVGVGYGAKAGSHLYGADGAHLYSGGGVGQTFFGLTNLQDSITVESFKSGKDMIELHGMSAAGVAQVLSTQTYANGVDTLIHLLLMVVIPIKDAYRYTVIVIAHPG